MNMLWKTFADFNVATREFTLKPEQEVAARAPSLYYSLSFFSPDFPNLFIPLYVTQAL